MINVTLKGGEIRQYEAGHNGLWMLPKPLDQGSTRLPVHAKSTGSHAICAPCCRMVVSLPFSPLTMRRGNMLSGILLRTSWRRPLNGCIRM